MKIVVVEDDRALRKLIRRMLSDHEVITYSDADDLFKAEVWEGVDATVIDLVYRTGKYTGFDLMRWLKREQLGGRRVVLTGHDRLDAEVLRWFTEVVLIKPVDRKVLRRAVLGNDDDAVDS
jgi:DNA-binding response OmpR family regulator